MNSINNMNYQEQISNLIAKNVFSEGFYNILKEKYNDLEILCFVYKEYLNFDESILKINACIYETNYNKVKRYVNLLEGDTSEVDSILDSHLSSSEKRESVAYYPFSDRDEK